jgi:hypothetical protein
LRKHELVLCVKLGNTFMQVVSEVMFENLESKWATKEEWEDTRFPWSACSCRLLWRDVRCRHGMSRM